MSSPYAGKPWLRHYDFWVPENFNYPRQSLYQILMLAAGQYHDRPATSFLGAQLTFGEIKRQANRLSTALAELGIVKGDRVGIMLPNCPQFLISFFAIVRLGAVVSSVNPLYTPRETQFLAADSGMRAIITLDSLVPAIESIRKETRIETVISTSLAAYSASPGSAAPAPAGALDFSQLIAAVSEARLPQVEIDAEKDLALLTYTGGTTGPPKGAMLTHSNLYAATLQAALWGQYLTRRGEDSMLLVIPYYHIYGQVVGMLLSPWNGTMQILLPKFDIELLIESFRRHRPTHFPGVPTLFLALLNHPEAGNCGLEHVRSFNSGSAPLPVEVITKFELLTGAMLREGYGMTETSAVASSTPLLARRKPGSVVLPAVGTEFKIVDLETGAKEVAVGEEGELCIRGPQITRGYWNKPEETAHAIRDGWLYTGDVARMDEDGYFYIVQRKKDMIIVSGFKVFPTEVEEVLFTHPAVMEASVIGRAHGYRGEEVKAFIVLKPGRSANAEEITAYCRTRLAKFKVPTQVEFLDSLPKSAVGKVLRRSLREREEALG